MNTIIEDLELDNDAVLALKALCKETQMSPSKTVQSAIMAYRRMVANEKFLGKGVLDLVDDHPNETKGLLKKSIREKYGYSA